VLRLFINASGILVPGRDQNLIGALFRTRGTLSQAFLLRKSSRTPGQIAPNRLMYGG